MDINDLTPQEKSVLLAKAMGWETYPMYQGSDTHLFNAPGDEVNHSSFYHPENMALAKKAFVWGYANVAGFRAWLDMPPHAKIVLLGSRGIAWALDTLIIEASKVNLLAIEAGLVAEEERDDG